MTPMYKADDVDRRIAELEAIINKQQEILDA